VGAFQFRLSRTREIKIRRWPDVRSPREEQAGVLCAVGADNFLAAHHADEFAQGIGSAGRTENVAGEALALLPQSSWLKMN
jgi:hypothetical protein